VRAPLEMRTAVLKEAEIFKARVIDSSTEGFALEATDDPEKLDEFIQVMRSYGEIEVIRSGAVAMSLEAKKLRLQPPVATPAGSRDPQNGSQMGRRGDGATRRDTEVELIEES
jgi:acetolactate synthase I/III small subunit